MNLVKSTSRVLGKLILPAAPILMAAAGLGCTNRSGTAYVEIVNEQNPGGKAEPILVDPRLLVYQNEYRTSWLNEGSNIKQRIVIRGPIMIVPAPATQPSGGR